MLTALLVITLILSAANGANDNIKGAATLIGSGLLNYRQALVGATIATALGGLASIALAQELLMLFSGRGIVPDGLTATPSFLLSVALAAAMTVAIASSAGLPISTTHALVGGLLGAGFGSNAEVNLLAAANATAWPLLLSPLLAIVLALALLPVALAVRRRLQPVCACDVPVGVATASVARIASRLGLPVSTTHVSNGALFGIALRERSGSPSVIRNILLAWLATLPAAALFAFAIATNLRNLP